MGTISSRLNRDQGDARAFRVNPIDFDDAGIVQATTAYAFERIKYLG
jgi:hypothetical protein